MSRTKSNAFGGRQRLRVCFGARNETCSGRSPENSRRTEFGLVENRPADSALLSGKRGNRNG